MGNALANPTAKAHARALTWDEESVPDNAWVVSVWLESIQDLPRGIAGDMKPFADPYVTFKLSKGANGTFGPQPQRSSFRKHSLSPRWGPPEKFMFVVDESTIASGKWPGLLVEVMNYDLVKDKLMAESFFALSELDATKKHKAAVKSTTVPTDAATADLMEKDADSSSSTPASDDDDYVSGGVPISVPIRDVKTGDPFKGCTMNLRVAAAPKKVAFDFRMHTVVEFVRWTPDKGWDPANRLRGDPRRFALEARNSSNSSTDSSERRRSSGAAMLLRRKSSTPALLANSSSGLSSPALDRIMSRGSMPSTGAQDLESTISNSNSNGPALADAAPGVSFSADDFNTVAGLLDSGLPHAFRQEGAGGSRIKNNSSGGAGGGGGVQTVQQWAVVAGLGDTNGWQYCTTFSPRNTDWYEKPTRFSFCKRRFWRRKLKVIANSADSAGASVEANSGLPTYDGSRPIRVGWLSKRGLHNKAFRTRYFVLWPRALVYYKGEPPNYNMSEFVPAGALNLRGATVNISLDEANAITIAVAASERIYTLTKPIVSGQQGSDDNIIAWLDSLNFTIEGRYAEAANVNNEETPVDARMTIDPTLGLQGLAALVDGDDGSDRESHINEALDTLVDADDEDIDDDEIVSVIDVNEDYDIVNGNADRGDSRSHNENAGGSNGDSGNGSSHSGDGFKVADVADGGEGHGESGEGDSGNGNVGSGDNVDGNVESGNGNTNDAGNGTPSTTVDDEKSTLSSELGEELLHHV